jgi:hypothetical protein
MYFLLGGIVSPGTIAPGGIHGFKRETGWDIKKGKGTQGATLTLKDIPPIEGKITLNLITDADFAAYDAFVANVLSISPKEQQAQGLPIYYPAFSSIGLRTVVVKHYTPPIEVGGKRKYQVEIELLEWQPPPAASVVSTVTTTASGAASPGGPPRPPNPLQAQLDAAKAAFLAASQAAAQ